MFLEFPNVLSAMSVAIAALYILCIVALPSFALAVYVRAPGERLNRLFALLALGLWAWVTSLFAFNLPVTRPETLLLGRLNFAVAVPTVTLGLCFISVLAGRPLRYARLIWAETSVLAAVSLLTAWVDKAELIVGGQHLTVYGPGFPLYLLHVVGYVAAILWTAFRPPQHTGRETKEQLSFLGYGILGTAAVSLVTNAILPYFFGNFKFIHVGTVSTVIFLAAASAAVVSHHLFNVHLIIRMTFIFGGLIALALGLYQLALASLVHLLPISNASDRGTAATFIVLVINAFTLDALKNWLGGFADRLSRESRKTVQPAGAKA